MPQWLKHAIVGAGFVLFFVQLSLHKASKSVPTRGSIEDRVLKLAVEVEEEAAALAGIVKKAESSRIAKNQKKAPPENGENATPLAEALAIHDKKAAEEVAESCEKTKDFQSSAHFHDFYAPKQGGWLLPTGDGEDVRSCNPNNFSASKQQVQDCQQYISNTNNWKYLRPMDSVLSKARTIKFIVQTKDPDVKAILKIPQFKFMVEPYSEYAAYMVDNMLDIHRVPPTAWVPVPVDWFRASMSVLMPAMYVQWVECYALKKKGLREGIRKWNGREDDAMFVSAQLWMKGVKELPKSPLRLHPQAEAMFDPSAAYVAKTPIEAWAMREASDLQIFDHVIGNNDRTPSKNAFAVGSCDDTSSNTWDCSSLDNKAKLPRMVYLDQGSSFYSAKPTRVSVFKTEDSKVCMFRRRTFEKVMSLKGDGAMLAKFEEMLPKEGFWNRWEKWQANGAQDRLTALAAHMERCMATHGEKVFLD